ncbi:MAG: Response regulator, partial [Deferribacteraceae bacterium]|nr:Response regulator [Deferribacteraceae bacterium]
MIMNKIAIIDDEKNFARLLALNLESEGFLTNVFFSGEEFLKFLENDEPDVVLLDLNLPDNHGLNIFNYILKTSPLTQVIVITAHGDMETAVEAVNMGCFDYINKPFGTDEIIVIIKRALEKKRLLHEINFRRRS